MAITSEELVSGSVVGSDTFALTSWTPLVGELVLLWIALDNDNIVESIEGNGLHFTRIAWVPHSLGTQSLGLWRSEPGGIPTTGQITITLDVSGAAYAIAERYSGVSAKGARGGDGIAAVAISADDVSDNAPTMTISNIAKGTATIVSACSHSPANFSVGSGWTAVSLNNSAGIPPDTAKLSVQYKETNAGKITADGSLSASVDWVMIAVALQAATPKRRYFGTGIECLIGDQTGRIIAELQPFLGPVAWRLNDVGQAPLTMPKNGMKFLKDYLDIGNRVLIRFDNGLPAWGGVMDFARTWGWHTLDMTSLSGEHLLSLITTGKNRLFTNSQIDTIFTALLNEADAIFPTGINLGLASAGGGLYSTEYHYGNLLQAIRDELTNKLSANHFYIQADEVDGYITFTANLVEERGLVKPNVALLEGHNVGGIEYTEQGPLINSWDVVGADLSSEGDSWGSLRLVSHLDNTASIAAYGLRQGSVMRTSEEIQGNLDAEAGQLLASTTNPGRLFTLLAANLAPGLFRDYDLGDSVWLEALTYGWGPDGFAGLVTLEQREFDPQTNLCKVNLREVVS